MARSKTGKDHSNSTGRTETQPLVDKAMDGDRFWMRSLQQNTEQLEKDRPNYYRHDLESLRTTSDPSAFLVGTGANIYEQLQESIVSAKKEVLLITCFWAGSPSLVTLSRALRTLSEKTCREGRPKVKVFIGFSSLSLLQKLFQTSSLDGKIYQPGDWPKKLGLPPAEVLPGLDMCVKSIFVRPFSVMHPKFVIIDRKLAWLPSCNVSWENWFEGAVTLTGPVVGQFVQFWQNFWDQSQLATDFGEEINEERPALPAKVHDSSSLVGRPLAIGADVETYFLPSPHHQFALCIPFWPSTAPQKPPATPLGAFLTSHVKSARRSIFIQTPNLTCFAIMHELLGALERGVNVSITTSSRLMILEQLVTAGITTSRAVKWMMRQYQQLQLKSQKDPEAYPRPGELTVFFFKARVGSGEGDPVQSHIKLSIIDDEIVVLGSQNLDRASWFTSQELGVAFKSREMASEVKSILEKAMTGRREQAPSA